MAGSRGSLLIRSASQGAAKSCLLWWILASLFQSIDEDGTHPTTILVGKTGLLYIFKDAFCIFFFQLQLKQAEFH